MENEFDPKAITAKILNDLEANFPDHLFDTLNHYNRNEQLELVAYILEHYGGNLSHEFLLKAYKLTNSFHFNDWVQVILLMNHNAALGIDSLVSFLYFHSKKTSFLDEEKVKLFSQSITRYYSRDIDEEKRSQFEYRNKRVYKKMNLSDDDLDSNLLISYTSKE